MALMLVFLDENIIGECPFLTRVHVECHILVNTVASQKHFNLGLLWTRLVVQIDSTVAPLNDEPVIRYNAHLVLAADYAEDTALTFAPLLRVALQLRHEELHQRREYPRMRRMLIFQFQCERGRIVFAVDNEVVLCYAIFDEVHLTLWHVPQWPVWQIADIDRAAALLDIPVMRNNHRTGGLP